MASWSVNPDRARAGSASLVLSELHGFPLMHRREVCWMNKRGAVEKELSRFTIRADATPLGAE